MKIVNQNPIYDYGDYRTFIKNFYTSKKAESSAFSLTTFARKVGFSKVAIKYVIDQMRHIADDNIPTFCKALNLDGSEANYFSSLVKFNKSKVMEERNEHFKSMLRIKGSPLHDRSLDASNIGYFQDWFYPAIAELSFTAGFQKDSQWIRDHLFFKVPKGKIAKAVTYLEVNGYLNGSAPNFARVKAAEEISSHVGKQFILRQIEIGREAVELQSKDDREVFSLTISVDEAKFQLAKRMVAEFRHQLHDLLANTEASERVVQINMQMFTLARTED